MISGFNHNVKYKDHIYHIQTEDSGVSNPHIITHIYRQGDIIATDRKDYAHLVGSKDMEKQVLELMQEQHKKMMRNLVRGGYDALLDRASLVDHHEPSIPSAGEPPVELREQSSAPSAFPEVAPEASYEKTQETLVIPEYAAAAPRRSVQGEEENTLHSSGQHQGMPRASNPKDEGPETTETPVYEVMNTDIDADPLTIEQEHDGELDVSDGANQEKTTESIPPWPLDEEDHPPEHDANPFMAPPKGWDGDGHTTDQISIDQLDSSEEEEQVDAPVAAKARPIIFAEDLVSDQSLDQVILKYLKDELKSS